MYLCHTAMKRENEIYRVTLIGSAGNALLIALKFTAGLLGHSAALIADAVHSVSDFITDFVVLVFVRISAKPQDQSHGYGHGKFETMATFLIGLALVAAALGIMLSGGRLLLDWWHGVPIEMPKPIALWMALISVIVKELLFWYTISKGHRLNSQAMIANAWHHRSDALSSVVAALGIGGAIGLGNQWLVLDPLASIVVGLILLKVAWNVLKNCMGELTEQSLPAETEHEIMRIIESFADVQEPHNLRTRRIGNSIAIDVHVRMEGNLTLDTVHSRASTIEVKPKEHFGPQTHVTLHMEPIAQNKN